MDDAFSCYRGDDSDWVDAWRVQLSCPAIRQDTLMAHLYPDQEPALDHSQPSSHRSSAPALRPDQKNRRPTDKLQLLSWYLGPSRRSDPSTLASHLNGPWHVVCVQEGACFITDRSLAENFHVITKHHYAVLLNKDTFERDCTCTPKQVPCSLRYSSWADERMVVTGKFRRAPDPSCSYFTLPRKRGKRSQG